MLQKLDDYKITNLDIEVFPWFDADFLQLFNQLVFISSVALLVCVSMYVSFWVRFNLVMLHLVALTDDFLTKVLQFFFTKISESFFACCLEFFPCLDTNLNSCCEYQYISFILIVFFHK